MVDYFFTLEDGDAYSVGINLSFELSKSSGESEGAGNLNEGDGVLVTKTLTTLAKIFAYLHGEVELKDVGDVGGVEFMLQGKEEDEVLLCGAEAEVELEVKEVEEEEVEVTELSEDMVQVRR